MAISDFDKVAIGAGLVGLTTFAILTGVFVMSHPIIISLMMAFAAALAVAGLAFAVYGIVRFAMDWFNAPANEATHQPLDDLDMDQDIELEVLKNVSGQANQITAERTEAKQIGVEQTEQQTEVSLGNL